MADQARNAYQATHGVHLAIADLVRAGMAGDVEGVESLARQLAAVPPRGIRETDAFRSAISLAIDNATTRKRSIARSFRNDDDGVLRREAADLAAQDLVFNGQLGVALHELVRERAHSSELSAVGLEPTSKLLLVGEPGVGKTMSAHWLAGHLNLPLYSLDLATTMSSFLGETGRNLQSAFALARSHGAIFFVDEFDAISKRRDDSSDLGELKRLVNVLLLELDRWEGPGLLIAATNHGALLDPAIQRRFDRVIEVPLPNADEARTLLRSVLGEAAPKGPLLDALVAGLRGWSNSDIVRFCRAAYRSAVVSGTGLEATLAERIATDSNLSDDTRDQVWAFLNRSGYSFRAIADMAHVSHPTVSARVKKVPKPNERRISA